MDVESKNFSVSAWLRKLDLWVKQQVRNSTSGNLWKWIFRARTSGELILVGLKGHLEVVNVYKRYA